MKPEKTLPSLNIAATRDFTCLPMLMAVLCLVCLVGCRHNTATGVEPVGEYKLVSVDGKPVPCTVEHDGHSIAIRSGSFVISRDGTCRSRMLFSAGPSSDHTREVKATYNLRGTELDMQWEGAGRTHGTIRGDTFTMNNEGSVLAYRR